jgi:hypothetical protein
MYSPEDSPLSPKDSPLSPKDSPLSPKDSPLSPKDEVYEVSPDEPCGTDSFTTSGDAP